MKVIFRVNRFSRIVAAVIFSLLALASSLAQAADNNSLAKQSQNPVAKMISLPFENNINGGYGSNDSVQNVLNIKPVIPQQLNENWNWIHRSIIPVVSQPGIPNNSDVNRTNGLGDTIYQGFLTPAAPGAWIWGAGPAVQIPTHTDDVLGNENWAAGPALVLLSMPGHWVFGGLVTQVWDFADSGNDGSDDDISLMLAQPFVNYNFKSGWYFNSSPLIVANWEAESKNQWTVPVGGGVGKIVRWGKQAINLRASYYYNVEKPEISADWNVQLMANWLFPK